MTPRLRVGLSPCPNDTFAFEALLSGRVAPALRLDPVIEDVESLNRRALAGELEVTKLSFHAWLRCADRYLLLRTGAALGRGCGPLLVHRDPSLTRGDLGRLRIAIPGELTTAALLLQLMAPEASHLVAMPFDRVLPAIESGEVEAGLLIHELRFTYRERGFLALVDLGEWWESETGHPIPLGAIAARRDLDPATVAAFDEGLAASLRHAYAHPADPLPFMRCHAADMDEAVMRSHVGLYVNDFTLALGPAGEAAVRELARRARDLGRCGRLPEPWIR